MKIEIHENIERLLLSAGYKRYGTSEYQLVKKRKKSYFDAIIDYNYPILNLHLDKPRNKKKKDSLNHTTTQYHPQVREEANRLINLTFEGKLEKIKLKYLKLCLK